MIQQEQAVYLWGRKRIGDGSNYALNDGHAKYFRVPKPSFTSAWTSATATNWYQIKPVTSGGPVVYGRKQNPGAAAWFLEN